MFCLHKHILPMDVAFFKSLPLFHQLVGLYHPRSYQGTFELPEQDDRPLLYISLGTFLNERPAVFKTCLKAFGDTSWRVVISRGQRSVRQILGPIPRNITVANFVPQLEILPRTRVFITHAGANSVMESLFYGVPMIAIPQMPEQAINADNMAKLGVGTVLHPHIITADILREAVERVVSDQAVTERCRAAQMMVRQLGGYAWAADALMQYATSSDTERPVPFRGNDGNWSCHPEIRTRTHQNRTIWSDRS